MRPIGKVRDLTHWDCIDGHARGQAPRTGFACGRISVSDQDKEALLKFAATNPLLTVSGYDAAPDPESGVAGIALAGRPFTRLIDREGRVRDRIIRYSCEEFETVVKKLL